MGTILKQVYMLSKLKTKPLFSYNWRYKGFSVSGDHDVMTSLLSREECRKDSCQRHVPAVQSSVCSASKSGDINICRSQVT